MGLIDHVKSTLDNPQAQCALAAGIFPLAGLVVCTPMGDEVAASALTMTESEYFKGFGLVKEESDYITLRFIRESGTFEERRVSRQVGLVPRMKGRYRGLEGEIEILKVKKDNGEDMQVWSFYVKDQNNQDQLVAVKRIERKTGVIEILRTVADSYFPTHSSYVGPRKIQGNNTGEKPKGFPPNSLPLSDKYKPSTSWKGVKRWGVSHQK